MSEIETFVLNLLVGIVDAVGVERLLALVIHHTGTDAAKVALEAAIVADELAADELENKKFPK